MRVCIIVTQNSSTIAHASRLHVHLRTGKNSSQFPCGLQDTTVWRARLASTILPTDDAHMFMKGSTSALFYFIAKGNFVWTVTASTARLQEVGQEVRLGPIGSQRPAEKGSSSSTADEQQPNQQLPEVSALEVCQGRQVSRTLSVMLTSSVETCCNSRHRQTVLLAGCAATIKLRRS